MIGLHLFDRISKPPLLFFKRIGHYSFITPVIITAVTKLDIIFD